VVRDFYCLQALLHKAFPRPLQDSFVIHRTSVVYPLCTTGFHRTVHSFIHSLGATRPTGMRKLGHSHILGPVRSDRTIVLTALLAGNATLVIATVILVVGDLHQPQPGLNPVAALLLTAQTLVIAGWLWILVRLLPAAAARLLRPGFVLLGISALLGAAGNWVLHFQFDRSLTQIQRQDPFLQLHLGSAVPDSELVSFVAGLLTAAGWLAWAVLARPTIADRAAGAEPERSAGPAA